jgi:hypothetical protein
MRPRHQRGVGPGGAVGASVLDGREHDGRLDNHGPEERSVCRVWAPLVFARVD